MSIDLFQLAVNLIEKEYNEHIFPQVLESPSQQDWRFLTSSKESFQTNAPILILDGHPGTIPAGNLAFINETCGNDGSSYFKEQWATVLAPGQHRTQKNMHAFIHDIHEMLGAKQSDVDFATKSVLSAYYSPFRTSSDPKDCRLELTPGFSLNLWSAILSKIQPPLIFIFSSAAYNELTKFYGDSCTNLHNDMPVGQNFTLKFSSI